MTHETPEWLVATVKYEGYPLALRVRPHADTVEHRSRLPFVAAVTHHLALTRADGMPEPDYNDSLAVLDHAVIGTLEASGSGLTVLVETLAGKRTYYAYVEAESHAQAAVARLCSSFPGERITLVVRRDVAWDLYGEYKRRFPW